MAFRHMRPEAGRARTVPQYPVQGILRNGRSGASFGAGLFHAFVVRVPAVVCAVFPDGNAVFYEMVTAFAEMYTASFSEDAAFISEEAATFSEDAAFIS